MTIRKLVTRRRRHRYLGAARHDRRRLRRLVGKRAPERTPAQRGAATAARKRAIAGNWCAAAALDDDQLDTPGYRPRHGWKPATGTGTAPDIRPPARRRRHHRRKSA